MDDFETAKIEAWLLSQVGKPPTKEGFYVTVEVINGENVFTIKKVDEPTQERGRAIRRS